MRDYLQVELCLQGSTRLVNLEKARCEEGEIGVLARDLNNEDPYTMESEVFQYAAENYKIKNGGREKMRERIEDMESKKFLEIVEDVERRSKAEGIREGEKKGAHKKKHRSCKKYD